MPDDMRAYLKTTLLALAAGSTTALAAEPPAAAYDSAFTDYKPYREPVLRLAGRDTVKPPAKAADPHSGHAMHGAAPADKADPHAGHHDAADKPPPVQEQKPRQEQAPAQSHDHHEHHEH